MKLLFTFIQFIFITSSFVVITYAEDCSTLLQLTQDGSAITSIYSTILQKKEFRFVKTVFDSKNDLEVSVKLFEGVPSFLKKAKPKEYEVFRVYFEEKEVYEQVKKSNRLFSSLQPYVRFSPDKEIYSDLTGVFLTKPNIPAQMVGLSQSANQYYIDITIDPNIQIYEIEKGRIYLIPLPKRNPQWVLDVYSKFIQTGVVDYYNEDMVKSLKDKYIDSFKYYIPVTLTQP